MATIKNIKATNAGEDVGKKEPSCTAGDNVNLLKPLWKTV
jgi:hypothetical protein